MALDAFVNFAISTLAAGISSGATSVSVVAGGGAKFPAVSFNATIWNATDYPSPDLDLNVEIVRVTAIATDTLTVTRGQEGTSAVAHDSSKTYKILAGITALTANKLADKTVTPQVLGSSGTASSASSSVTEVNHAAIKIPAGTMGLNGKVWFLILFKFVGTAAAKTINVRHSTTSGDTSAGTLIFSFATGATALAYWLNGREFQNSNSASAQIFYRALSGGQGSDANAPATAAINTANDSWLNLNGFVTNAGDSFQVVSYSVVFFPGV